MQKTNCMMNTNLQHMNRAFSIDPEFTQIVDQLLGFEYGKVIVYLPFVPIEKRKKSFGTLSLREGQEHKCIRVAFGIDKANDVPINIKICIRQVFNEREYATEYTQPHEIAGLSKFGRNILLAFKIGKIFRFANMAVSLFAMKNNIPFLGRYDNDNLFIGHKYQNENRPTWTAPLRRECDRINIINLGNYLENKELLYNEDYLIDYIEQRKGSFFTAEKLKEAQSKSNAKNLEMNIDKTTEGKQNKKFSKKKKEEKSRRHRRHH